MTSIQSKLDDIYRKESKFFYTCVLVLGGLIVLTAIVSQSVIATGVSALVAAVLSLVLQRIAIEYGKDLTDAAYYAQLEHIIEHSCNENDSGVYLRAQEHRQQLKDSGNPYKVRVYEIIFREGIYADETWEEYEQRLRQERHTIITQRHQELQARSRTDYLKALAGQQIK